VRRNAFVGMNAVVMDEEVAWKLAGIRTHQDLTRRCIASRREVHSLTEMKAERARLQAPQVPPFIAMKRG